MPEKSRVSLRFVPAEIRSEVEALSANQQRELAAIYREYTDRRGSHGEVHISPQPGSRKYPWLRR